jgi:hypothetical protein
MNNSNLNEENLIEEETNLEIDDNSQEEQELEIDNLEQRKIIWQAKDFSIREFQSMYQDGEIDLQPEYQRKFVATPAISSKLIESVLMDVPIPVIYLAEEKDGSYSVIDGQQRLTSFISFLNGKFPDGNDFKLTSLKVLKELNKSSFSALDKELQNKLKTTTLHTIIIKKESNEDIKFEIFERLNTGSIKLNEDEIRNTVYRGPYLKLLSELENNEHYHKIISKSNFKKRMIYRGMILRFFALSEKTYLNYKPSMKQFCNKELRDNRFLSDEKAKEYRERFEKCIELVKIVFGDKAFRRYKPYSENAGKGNWAISRINMALYDIQMCGFVNYTKNEVLQHADEIREAMLDLMLNNKQFRDAILIETSNKEVLKLRFQIWYSKLDEIIGDKSYQQRTFPYSVKKELFDKNPVCALSKQTILSIEDAEVDHILPYSKGGKTTIENAQLVLRHFNRAKKDNVNYKP